jgi:hypothetical protein
MKDFFIDLFPSVPGYYADVIMIFFKPTDIFEI